MERTGHHKAPVQACAEVGLVPPAPRVQTWTLPAVRGREWWRHRPSVHTPRRAPLFAGDGRCIAAAAVTRAPVCAAVIQPD